MKTILTIIGLLAAMIFAAFALALPGHAQTVPTCMAAGDISDALESKYGESPIFAGLDTRGALILVYLSASGTWTAVVSGPDGQACMIGSGSGGYTAELPPPGEAG